jgi:ABC-type multidrug transport system ATPase subunit/ABC-type multidrug transport system permease subunit
MCASVTYWDNPTRGLDASTSLDFIRLLRQLTTINRHTAMACLYQVSDNITYQFDKVTVLYAGYQIFFGTVPDAKSFFKDLGFLCKPRQTTADFLTAITDPYARRVKPGWESRTPRSPEDFVRAWKNSVHHAQMKSDMQRYDEDFAQTQDQFHAYHRYQLLRKAPHQREQGVYTINLGMQFNAILKRAFHRLVGDTAFLGAMAFASVFISLMMGSMFFDLSNTTAAFYSKSGVLFFAVLFNAVQTLSEIGTQYAQRPIVQRQRTYAMYHPFADAIASMFAQYPYKLVTVSIFDVVIYFMANMKQQPAAFFIFWVTTYLAALVMSSYFRTLAALAKRPEAAIGLGGISVLAFAIYTGYVIPKPSMHPWFKWITYINPLSYAFEVLMANEFHDSMATCSSLIPSGAGFQNVSLSNQVCPVVGAKPGESLVNGDDYVRLSFDYSYASIGRNIGILCAFLCAFTITFALATEFNTLGTGHGVLVFRKGREPKTVRKALQEGKPPEEVELQNNFEPLTEIKTVVSEVKGLLKSSRVLTWEQLSYDISVANGESRRLLSNVSGYVKPGTLTAIMGESGAGKTTLFNVLAGRVEVGVKSGRITVNGSPPGQFFQRRVGFVQQQDVHLPESTVREALRFSATLRQPKDVSVQEKYAYVEKVIDILEMQDFADAVIGVPGSGLDVEQRKKTTIGIELVAKPEFVLFLDEPTSGLDSQSAWSIVRVLRKLVNSGQTILCTIHQPSSILFEQFDHLLLLQKGGKTAYFGDIGDSSRTVIDYFESNGAFQCPESANPAEYVLDVVGAGATSRLDRDWSEVWERSAEHDMTVVEIQALKTKWADRATNDGTQSVDTEFAMPWFRQYRAVQSRLYLHYWRNPTYIKGKVMLNVVSGLFIGFTFYKEGDSVQGLQNKVACHKPPSQHS